MRASSTCAVRLGAMLGIVLLLLLSAKRRSAAQLTNVLLLTPSAKHGSLKSLAAPQRCAPPSLAGRCLPSDSTPARPRPPRSPSTSRTRRCQRRGKCTAIRHQGSGVGTIDGGLLAHHGASSAATNIERRRGGIDSAARCVVGPETFQGIVHVGPIVGARRQGRTEGHLMW